MVVPLIVSLKKLPLFPKILNFVHGTYYKDKNLSEDDEGLSILTGLPTLKKGNKFLKAAYTYIFNQGIQIQDPSMRKQFLKKNFFVDINSQTRQFRLDALKEFFIGFKDVGKMHQYIVHMECDGMLKPEVQKVLENKEFRIRRNNMQSLLPYLYLFTKVKLID